MQVKFKEHLVGVGIPCGSHLTGPCVFFRKIFSSLCFLDSFSYLELEQLVTSTGVELACLTNSLPSKLQDWWLYSGHLGPTGFLTLENQSLIWLKMFYSYRNKLLTSGLLCSMFLRATRGL